MVDANDSESREITEAQIGKKIIEGAEIVVSLSDTGTTVINPFDQVPVEPPSEGEAPSQSSSTNDSAEG